MDSLTTELEAGSVLLVDDDAIGLPLLDETKILRLERHLARKNQELEEINRRMRLDLEAATRVQESFLPKPAPPNEHARLTWAYHLCQELGGDFLDVFTFGARQLRTVAVTKPGRDLQITVDGLDQEVTAWTGANGLRDDLAIVAA